MAKTLTPEPLRRVLSGDARDRRRLEELVTTINDLEPSFSERSDEQLRIHREVLAGHLAQGASLEEILPEAFACVREASRRTLGMRHYDVQVMAACAVALGNVAEARTGEGKTLVATMPLYLHAIAGDNAHLATANPYLARRDAQWMEPTYRALGMSVGVLDPDEAGNIAARQRAYAADITYGTSSEFGFDYLRDNLALDVATQVQRGHHFLVVDEVDAVLIDEAQTPLIISGPGEDHSDEYRILAEVVAGLVEGEDYHLDEKHRTISPDEGALAAAEQALGVDSLVDPRNARAYNHLTQALIARALKHRDREYVVAGGEVLIIDDNTGRARPGHQWGDGLHQAVEAKEGVEITAENITLATISIQNYVRLYSRLGGMSGTAKTDEEELQSIYAMKVSVIPPHRPSRRRDRADLIYRSDQARLAAMLEEVRTRHDLGQPILIGTPRVDASEQMSALLRAEGLEHELLSAKDHAREAEIIGRAGQRGAITIATNMAGRGVDVLLGEGVAELGGLCVLGTARHDARRIDLQLKGRAGRQGDPGETRFYLSAEDDLVRLFAGDRVERLLARLPGDHDRPLELRAVSRAVEQAQKTLEARGKEAREELLKYDEVLHKQRLAWFARRQRVIEGRMTPDEVAGMLVALADHIAAIADEDRAGAATLLARVAPQVIPPVDLPGWRNLPDALLAAWETTRCLAPADMDVMARTVTLDAMDQFWREHLNTMVAIRDGIHWRQIAQRNPVTEYTIEAAQLFDELEVALFMSVAEGLLALDLDDPPGRAEPSAAVSRAGTPAPASVVSRGEGE